MITLEDLYSLLESTFDFLLVADDNERIHYVSPLMKRLCSPSGKQVVGLNLDEILEEESLTSLRKAIKRARAGSHTVPALFSTGRSGSIPVPMKVGYSKSVAGSFYLLFGMQADTLRQIDTWEKEERVKELSCLYSVAEWIEVSETIDDFFVRLPSFLSRGLKYPSEAVVYSTYQDTEYGEIPEGEEFISVQLFVNKEETGEIRAGYINPGKEFLPEEQKMLDQIGRMLSLALERKELRERIALKQDEGKKYASMLAQLQKEISSKENQLEAQKQRLSTVDSYLYQVSETMQESSRRLETTFKAIPDKVLLIDPDRNVLMSNRDDIEIGGKCYTTCFGRDTPCPDCRLSKIIRNKTPISIIIRDEDKYLEVHALPIFNNDEEVEGILEFYRDVTLEKTYEQQIEQADKLASLGQLVSGIGHEINNPNQFIRGNIKIVKQALDDMLPIVDAYYRDNPDLKIARLKYDFFREHIMTLVDDMGHGSERIRGIVKGLQGFAGKDEGLLVDDVDINTLIEATQRLIQNEVHKHADIELNLSENVETFPGNSQKMEQVLVNLIVNAAQAIPDHRKGHIKVSTSMNRKMVVIEIEDNGIGMDEKTSRQIFDPFFTTKRTKGGTGLGLAISYRIVDEHRGTITVASRPGLGTKFTVRIPVNQEDGEEQS
jgi:signal transduction histidine kinase